VEVSFGVRPFQTRARVLSELWRLRITNKKMIGDCKGKRRKGEYDQTIARRLDESRIGSISVRFADIIIYNRALITRKMQAG